MDRQLQEQQDAAEARELHWAANKHKKPRPFYHWFAKVDHPAPEESSQRSSTSTVLSTTPQRLVPQTITMPSTIKKRKSLASSSSNISVQKPPALEVPNEKKLHYGNMVKHQTNTTPMTRLPLPVNFLTLCLIWQPSQRRKTMIKMMFSLASGLYQIQIQTQIHPLQALLIHLCPIHLTQKIAHFVLF